MAQHADQEQKNSAQSTLRIFLVFVYIVEIILKSTSEYTNQKLVSVGLALKKKKNEKLAVLCFVQGNLRAS